MLLLDVIRLFISSLPYHYLFHFSAVATYAFFIDSVALKPRLSWLNGGFHL
jgi:hypothetical protein